MSFTGLLKKIIKKTVIKFGYELRALNVLQAKNAVEYNTIQFVDRFYSDPVLVNKYMNVNVPLHLRNLEALLRQHAIPVHAETSILDAGCGTGQCLKMLRDTYHCRNLSGSEFSVQALQIARTVCPDAHYYQLDLLEGHLPERYELILCQQVLEHLTKPELALRHLEQMLRQDGRLLITVPDGRLDDFAGHIHFWSRDSLTLFLQKELPGYSIVTGSLQDEVSLYAIIKRDQWPA